MEPFLDEKTKIKRDNAEGGRKVAIKAVICAKTSESRKMVCETLREGKLPVFSKNSTDDEIVAPIGMPHPEACVVCRDAACLRLPLRSCGHIVCIACFLGYIQGQIAIYAKVGIRCPSGWCTKEIHENDIRAVLDEKEAGFDVFITPVRRQWLQYCHDKDSVVLGLAGPDPKDQEALTRRCPLCKNIYYKRYGCNRVICPNIRCQTQFCWTCGKPINGLGHFANGKCRVAFDDVARGTLVFALLLQISFFGLLCMLVGVFIVCLLYMPMIIFLAFPYYGARRFYLSATTHTTFLTPLEWSILIIKMIFGAIITTIFGIPVAICSFFTGVCLSQFYIIIMLMKTIGVDQKILHKYDLFLPLADCLGLTLFKSMLKDGKDEKEREKRRLKSIEGREKMEKAEVV